MTAVLQGVRILEVAEHTFVPSASALLSDWGADVIKIEHVERGDAMRGLASTGLAGLGGDVHALLEHSNRGKRSLAVDLTTGEGLELVYKIAASADVFLTNKLPSVRSKLGIGLDERPRDSVSYRAGLAGDAAARHRDGEVELVGELHELERLAHDHAASLTTEEFVQRTLVHRDLAGAGFHVDASRGGLAAAGAVVRLCSSGHSSVP